MFTISLGLLFSNLVPFYSNKRRAKQCMVGINSDTILLAHISLILALICDNLDRGETQVLKMIRYKDRE